MLSKILKFFFYPQKLNCQLYIHIIYGSFVKDMCLSDLEYKTIELKKKWNYIYIKHDIILQVKHFEKVELL